MRREQVTRMLENYRRCAARRESLALEIDMARRQLAAEEARAVENAVLPGKELSAGRGGGIGDPTARVAVKFASGYRPRYILEMEGDLNRLRDEMEECGAVCRAVDVWLMALSDRERLVIERHVIGGETYAEVLEALSARFPAGAVTSPDGIKCLNRRAMDKICAAAGAEPAGKI